MKLTKQWTYEKNKRQITHRESEEERKNFVQKDLRTSEIPRVETIGVGRKSGNIDKMKV